MHGFTCPPFGELQLTEYVISDASRSATTQGEEWLAFERSFHEDYEEREREGFGRGAFDMLLEGMAYLDANDVQITITPHRAYFD